MSSYVARVSPDYSAHQVKPISVKQRALIEKLLTERDLTGTSYLGWQPDWARATSRQASTVIEFLFTRPKAVPPEESFGDFGEHDSQAPARPREAFGASWGSIPVGGRGYGYYALEVEDGVHKFFRVERPTEGRWAGKTFIKEQASDAFYPVEPKARGYVYLTEIAGDPEAAGLLYATLLEKCSRCGRTLTDADSRARGLGPDCASKGW